MFIQQLRSSIKEAVVVMVLAEALSREFTVGLS